MRTKSGLVYLAQSLALFFAAYAVAGSYGDLTITNPGTAAVTAGATAPKSDYEVRIRFTAGGTVGTPGISYAVSLDGGATELQKDLGTATSIAVWSEASGVTVNLGAGTILTGEVVAFTTEGPRKNARVDFGWRGMVEQTNQGPGGANRVVFRPGDDSGRDGPIVAVQRPGMRDVTPPPTTGMAGIRTRSLWDWNRVGLVSVWACDPARPQVDAASVEAVERLLEDVMQGIQALAAGLVTWGPPIWVIATTDTQYGREIRIPLSLRTTFFDLPFATGTPRPVVERKTPD